MSEENISSRPLTPLKLNGIQIFYDKELLARKIIPLKTEIRSFAMISPFQPHLLEDKIIDTVLTEIINTVANELNKTYCIDCTNKIVRRLSDLFTKLNINARQKSIAAILTRDGEKVLNLDFSVKKIMIFNRTISSLDLADNIKPEPDFFLLVVEKGFLKLFEYFNGHLNKVNELSVAEMNDNRTGEIDMYHKALRVIELLNREHEKPVFITGDVCCSETFLKENVFAKSIFKKLENPVGYDEEKIRMLATEIIDQWNAWHSNILNERMQIAQNGNMFIAGIDAVLQALRKGADGLLLIDKKLKDQLQRSKMPNLSVQEKHELMDRMEAFLLKGNCIEILENSMLKNVGDIVLLKNRKSWSSEDQSIYRHFGTGGILF